MNSTKTLDLHGMIDLAVKNIPDFTIKPLLINGVVVYLVSGVMFDKQLQRYEPKTHSQDLGAACGNLLMQISSLLDLDFDVLYEGRTAIIQFPLNPNAWPLP